MKQVSSIILLFCLFSTSHSTEDVDIPFKKEWLPIVRQLESMNSSSIQLVWGASGVIHDVDIDKLSGNFSVCLYVGNSMGAFKETVFYSANYLNLTDSITISGLTPDTIYYTCLETEWYGHNETINDDLLRYFPPPPCRLVRTYAADETTLNPIPSLGNYSWNYTVTNNDAKVINIHVSISSELPYKKRQISVQLGSQSQIIKIETPTEDFTFIFNEVDSNTNSYSLLIVYDLIDETNTYVVMNASTGTIYIPKNNGSDRSASNFFLLLFVSLFSLFIAFSAA